LLGRLENGRIWTARSKQTKIIVTRVSGRERIGGGGTRGGGRKIKGYRDNRVVWFV